jgi:hypothetical protein
MIHMNLSQNTGLEDAARIAAEDAQEAATQLQAAETPATSGLPEYLTPQSLVAYCECRLTSLDSQMQSIFNQQQSNASLTQAIDQVASDLNDLPQPAGSGTTITLTGADGAQIQSDYQAAIAEAKQQGQPQLAAQLQQDLCAFQSQATGDTIGPGTRVNFSKSFTLESDNVSSLSQNLKTYGSNLNSDSQMSMINLQSLMSQQQTAVELSTNLLQTLSQTDQNIASNLKAG